MKCGVPRLPGIASLAVWLLAGAVASAQPARVPVEQDTHLFRYILGKAQLTGLGSAAEIDAPARTMVILLGKTDALDQLRPSLLAFVRQGGALLVATDSAREGARLERPFELTIREGLSLRREDSPAAY